jgi:transcriptional regulator with XRE-family HTH domain
VFAQIINKLLGCAKQYRNEVTKVSLGERVRNQRKALSITQQQLANAVNITPQHISLIEQGKGSPSLELLPKLAETLGVTTDFLLTGRKGVITDAIPAIKADRKLTLKAKQSLIALIEELKT